MAEQKVITVVGGSGFLGRYVVRQLARAGLHDPRHFAPPPTMRLPLKTSGDVGQIVPVSANLAEPDHVRGQARPVLRGDQPRRHIIRIRPADVQRHTGAGTGKLAQMAKAAGAERFIHCLGARYRQGGAASRYARTKMLGEKAVLAAFPEATILRPSVMFGPEDNFFNQFARMSCLAPALPLIGGGRTKFQPVYVGDVRQSHRSMPRAAQPDVQGKIYELGGPHVYTLKEIFPVPLLDYPPPQAPRQPCPYRSASPRPWAPSWNSCRGRS